MHPEHHQQQARPQADQSFVAETPGLVSPRLAPVALLIVRDAPARRVRLVRLRLPHAVARVLDGPLEVEHGRGAGRVLHGGLFRCEVHVCAGDTGHP